MMNINKGKQMIGQTEKEEKVRKSNGNKEGNYDERE